jgi:uncharacterized protein DUF6527
MPKLRALKHQFVEFVPAQLEEGILYISVEYRTMAHFCCCGCGKKVVTPISPTGWVLTYDGRTVSVSPSVGNWNLPCKSHYVISGSRVQWAGQWSTKMIEKGFARDRQAKEDYYRTQPQASPSPPDSPTVASPKRRRFFTRIHAWWSGTQR